MSLPIQAGKNEMSKKIARLQGSEGGIDTANVLSAKGLGRRRNSEASSMSVDVGEPSSGLDPSTGLLSRYSQYQDLTADAVNKRNTLVADNRSLEEQIKDGVGERTTAPEIDAGYDTAFKLMDDLKKDFSVSNEVAAGMVGNLWHETGGFKFMQEIKPLAGRGGYQIAQWTGVRRKAFESYVEKLGLDKNSYEAGYGYLKTELMGSEEKNWDLIKEATTVKEAATLTSQKFLRPGKPNLKSRLNAAQDILDRYNEQQSVGE
tara:strand:+ start:182 stop:964 length:783 start_codon:yes stop_codon:yes gene_type:complete